MAKDAADDVRKLAFTLDALRQPAPFSDSVDLEVDIVAAVEWTSQRSPSEVQFVLGVWRGYRPLSFDR